MKTLLLVPAIRAMGRGADARLLGAAVTAPPLNDIVQLSLASRASADDAPTDPRAKTAKARLRDLATSEPGTGVADRNALERCANVVTSAPFFLCGRDVAPTRGGGEAEEHRARLARPRPRSPQHPRRRLPPADGPREDAQVGLGVSERRASPRARTTSPRAPNARFERRCGGSTTPPSRSRRWRRRTRTGTPSGRGGARRSIVRIPRVVTDATVAACVKFPLIVSAAHCALSGLFYRGARVGRRGRAFITRERFETAKGRT